MRTKIMLALLIVLALATVWFVYAAEQARMQQQSVGSIKILLK